MAYPDQEFWGKWNEERERFLSLLDHCADVAAVVEALLTRTLLGKRLARLGGLESLVQA